MDSYRRTSLCSELESHITKASLYDDFIKTRKFGYPIYVQIPKLKKPLPLFVLFRAFGIISDKEICKYILLDIDNPENEDLLKFLKGSIEDSEKYKTQEDSIQFMKGCVLYTPINMTLEEGEAKKQISPTKY